MAKHKPNYGLILAMLLDIVLLALIVWGIVRLAEMLK